MKLTTLFVSVLVAVGSLIAATAIPGANMVSVDIQGANQATEAIGTTLEKRNAQGGAIAFDSTSKLTKPFPARKAEVLSPEVDRCVMCRHYGKCNTVECRGCCG